MKTIVAYTLHNNDYTATLLRKAGLFWFVQDADGNEIRIPAKAVDETWEEADEPTTEAERDELIADQETPEPEPTTPDEPTEPAPTPSLAEQAAAGPTIEAPSDTITLAELCDTYGVVGRIARRQLRNAVKAGTLTHEHGTDWTFDRTKIDDIMKIITTKKRG